MSEAELAALPNLGPASARWLVGAGIRTVAELRRAGPIAAFGRVAVREGRAATANLLYALYAALEGKHWTEVTPAEKARLRRAVGLAEPARHGSRRRPANPRMQPTSASDRSSARGNSMTVQGRRPRRK